MTFAVLMILISRVFIAGSNIIDAHITSKLFSKLTTVVFYNGITNIIAIPIILCFGMPKMLPLDYMFIICLFSIVIIEILYQFPYYKSLKMLDTSVVVALFSLGKIALPIMAFLIVGEKLSFIQYFGFFIIIISNLILNLTKKDMNKKGFSVNIGFYLMLFVSLILSLQSVLQKKILLEIDWITIAFWYTIFTSLASFSLYFLSSARENIKSSFPIFKSKWKIFFATEILNQLTNIIIMMALTVLPVVVLKALTSTQPIFVLVIGIIMHKIYGDKFKEDVSKETIKKKLIFFIFIIFGVVLTIG